MSTSVSAKPRLLRLDLRPRNPSRSRDLVIDREPPIPTSASSDERRPYEYDEGDAKDWEMFGGSADEEAEAFILWDGPCKPFAGGKIS